MSKTGSSAAPYLTWETASDSIQKCIDISSYGDTIFVADGAYAEKIIMNPGISLIGSGNDSCIIDTRTLTYEGFYAVEFADDCLLTDFFIRVSYTWINDHWVGNGIRCIGGTGLIKNIKLEKGYIAFYSRDNASVKISDNSIYRFNTGIRLSNSDSPVQNNFITDVEYGIYNDASDAGHTPFIDNNTIIRSTMAGIFIHFSYLKPTIQNNYIFLDTPIADGIAAGGRDTMKIYNNLVISRIASEGITCNGVPALVYNNFVIGNFNLRGITANAHNIIINNSVINANRGILASVPAETIVQYNNSWNNGINYVSFTPDSTNISVNPMIVNYDSLNGEYDFHLQLFSPLINAGDPSLSDPDGSRSDIGLYGGPLGESYIYQDLAPHVPINFTAVVDSNIFLSWNKNTEADFLMYRLYRDTIPDFQIDSLNLISEQTDTSFIQVNPNAAGLYYKATSIDSQMNESIPSAEIAVVISSSGIPSVISDYILYQNYPNPFNPSTKIRYQLKERGYVKLYVYDIKGEIIASPVNEFQEAGYHEFNFLPGKQIASGMYIYHLNIKNENNVPVFSGSKKMIFLK